jgi:hypothetical protein
LWFVHMSSFGKKSWKFVDHLVGIATFRSYVHLHVALIYICTYLYSQINSSFSLWPVAKFGYICLLVDDQQSTYFTKLWKQKKKEKKTLSTMCVVITNRTKGRQWKQKCNRRSSVLLCCLH